MEFMERNIIKIKEENKKNDSDLLKNKIEGTEKHEVLFSDESSSLYSSTRKEASWKFDYEINSIRFGEEKDKEYMYILEENKLLGDKYKKLDPSTNLVDTIFVNYSGEESQNNIDNDSSSKFKANILKTLVSKKKRRIQNDSFDLDMCYITKRVIGMGFPATGLESFYRNSLTDIKTYLDRYHGEYKIYNLCIEKNRIYPKDLWEGRKVGLFPFNDHSPCPTKLILDFCVDLCLYLTANPTGVAAIHCKAGKGRTGVMIVSYLVFAGLFPNTDEALIHYAKQRTLNNKGVTIPSQIRYIKYFETFLCANFERPFLKCIPKIIKNDLNKGYYNMLMNYNTDMSYFTTLNGFKLKSCIIGPFTEEVDIEYDFAAITRKNLKFLKNKVNKKIIDKNIYYEIMSEKDDIINYDLKLMLSGKKLNFYTWFNLWFTTFEIISKYVINNNYFEDESNKELNINQALAKEETGETGLNDGKKNIISSIIDKANLKQFGRKTLSRAFHKIIENYTKKKVKKSALRSLKGTKDLNIILNDIDELAKEKDIPLLDRENLEFIIQRKELDKLKTNYEGDFQIKFTYELLK
jgi:hypothetical protein